MDTIGARIKAAREKKGMTQESLASALGVSINSVWRWEKGERAPSTGNLMRIAMELSVNVSSLIDGLDDAVDDDAVIEREGMIEYLTKEDLAVYIDSVKKLIRKLPYMESVDAFAQIEEVYIDELNDAKKKIYEIEGWNPPDHETYTKPTPAKLGGVIGRIFPSQERALQEKIAFYQELIEEQLIKDASADTQTCAKMLDNLRIHSFKFSDDELDDIEYILKSAIKVIEKTRQSRLQSAQPLDIGVAESI